MPRRFLGQQRDFGGAVRTYRAEGALEMDEIEGVHGTRRRIFFEDVLLVTLHEKPRLAVLIGTGLATLFFFMITVPLLIRESDRIAGLVVLLLFTGPFAAFFTARLLIAPLVVTVFGKHGRAQMVFDFRASKAREVHQLICREVRNAQAKLRPRQTSTPY